MPWNYKTSVDLKSSPPPWSQHWGGKHNIPMFCANFLNLAIWRTNIQIETCHMSQFETNQCKSTRGRWTNNRGPQRFQCKCQRDQRPTMVARGTSSFSNCFWVRWLYYLLGVSYKIQWKQLFLSTITNNPILTIPKLFWEKTTMKKNTKPKQHISPRQWTRSVGKNQEFHL